jgi:catechol 2,3-dioxygenase-like lactoylglutathione lyase family enzyme
VTVPVPRWFAHANVNALDLAESERFYTTCFDLSAQWRTAPAEPQDGAGFGMPGQGVRWEGALLADHRGVRGPVVDLLEWKEPPTAGRANGGASDLGLNAFLFAVADLDDVERRLVGVGARVVRVTEDDPASGGEVVITEDPSGTRVEVRAGAGAGTYQGVRINCTSLARSTEFYRESLAVEGDDVRSVSRSDGGRFDVRRMYLPGQRDRFFVELTQWREPVPSGRPTPVGNHAGIYRMALSVHDIDATWETLLAVVPDAPPPVTVALGPGLPDVRASFFPDPDGAILEYLERGIR